jgi:hypothetical protein
MHTRLVLLLGAVSIGATGCLTPAATDAGLAEVIDARVTDASVPADAEVLIDAPTECPAEPPAVCDLFLGCGCDTDAGKKCTLNQGVHACLTAGTTVAGEPCESDTQCELGTLCARMGDAFRCLQFCSDVYRCPPGQACYIRVTSTDPPDSVCGQVCGLLEQDCAFEGQSCFASKRVSLEEHGICGQSGTGTQSTPCKSPNDCAKGFQCVLAPGKTDFSCAMLCDRFKVNAGCPGETGCNEFMPPHIRTGVCL